MLCHKSQDVPVNALISNNQGFHRYDIKVMVILGKSDSVLFSVHLALPYILFDTIYR